MIIYKLTNKVNGKIYIGKTERTIEERMGEHVRHDYIIVDKAIRKYGIESFIVEVVDSADSLDELDKKEQEWIKKCDCLLPKGYNQTFGGSTSKGFQHRDKSKRKMSISKSEAYKEKGNPFYGKRHSEKSKEKMSQSRKGRVLSEEWKAKIGKAQQKKVINLDTGEIFDSVKAAAEHYNLKDTHITRVCKDKRKTTGGYRWLYYDA